MASLATTRDLGGLLCHEGIARVIARASGLTVERVSIEPSGPDGPKLEGMLFLDGRGRIAQPETLPYVPLKLRFTPTDKRYRLYRQYARLTTELARRFAERGLSTEVRLPPNFFDARAWTWSGFDALARYTMLISLPWSLDEACPSVRRRVRKAEREGFVSEEVSDFDAVASCLEAAQRHYGVSYALGSRELREIRDQAVGLLGYVSFSPSREPASARVVLVGQEGLALVWLSGTVRQYASSGCSQHLTAFMLDDLRRRGVHLVDLGGANVQSVAASKANLGGELHFFPALRQR